MRSNNSLPSTLQTAEASSGDQKRNEEEHSRQYAQLHDDVHLLLIFVNFVQFQNAGMVHLLHDLDLAAKQLYVILEHRFLDDFDGELGFILLVNGFVNNREPTAAAEKSVRSSAPGFRGVWPSTQETDRPISFPRV